MIRVEHLCKSFGEKNVLRDVSFTVDGPLVLMGPSGCGKTTTLRILMELESADAGRVCGVGRVAAVFQTDRLCPQLTAAANIELTGGANAENELRALGFTDAELALPSVRLSGGQKRRAALLRALLCRNADTLLLDEPFTGMEAELASRAAETVRRLRGERDTVLVTHDAAIADLLGWPVVQL